ncbi:MAG: hypothetical protein AAF409_21085 [Pseudomonadota bacterium]
MTDTTIDSNERNTSAAPNQETGLKAARESFHGRGLTETQFQEAWALSEILHCKIQQSGSFLDPLTDYSFAFAREQKFDTTRGEAIIRDVYQGRYGQTMNQTREVLMAAEETLPETAQARALTCAETISELIQAPPTQPFYQAYDRAAVTLSVELRITQTGAKTLMKDAFQAKHGRDLYEAGKEIEDAYHKPVREAEIAQRKAEKLQTRSRSQARG